MYELDELDVIRSRAAAANRVPIALRAARDRAAGFEEKAVTAVLQMIGRQELLRELRREAGARTGKAGPSFPLLHERLILPVTFRASRLRFDFDGVFMQLMNAFDGTPMWSAWQDARRSLENDDRRLALVFGWPQVRGCRQLCVLHDVATAEWAGTQVRRKVGDRVFTVETLPSLLAGLGLLAGSSPRG